MSAEAKPVEAPVVPAEPVVDAPATTETVEPPTESVETAPATEETTEAAVKEPAKPIEEGILGYKGPGFVKSLFFQKKFFWFGTEPVESKALSSYLRGEKNQEAANKNVAWAAHTGKGLLFFSKRVSEKATPAGLYNLSEVSDIAEDGTLAFIFKAAEHKHTFEAATLAERDNWVAQLKAKVAEATELAPTVVETEAYKKAHSDLVKPAVVAAALPKKSTEAPKEEKVEAAKEVKEEKKEEKAEKIEEKKEEKKTRKSRSASRKRASIFGSGFGSFGGKKEEKVEAPKEETPVVATETPAETAPVEPAAALVPETTEAATEATPEATPASPIEKPVITKRNSIFGSLKSPFGHKEKKAEEAPVVPAKDAEPVSENAPVIPAVEASEPLATSVASPATVPTETTEVSITNGETKAAETPVVKTDKRKSSLPWLSKKEKATSDEETEKVEKPKSPFAKLRATVKGKTSPKAEKPVEKPVESTETAAETATEIPAASEPAVTEPASEPAKVVPTTTPQVTASA